VDENSADRSSTPSNATASASHVSVDLRQLPWIKRLATDYAFDFGQLAPFFAGDPAAADAWTEMIRRRQAQPRETTNLSAMLVAQQTRRGAAPEAIAASERLADARTVAVVTGQQAGLFGGPLYTLLKALTALQLAERTSRTHGVPAVAIFWIEAEDHDWNEVRSTHVFDETYASRAVSLPARADHTTPVAQVRLDESVVGALDALEQLLAPTEFRAALMADLRAAYTPGTGMAEAFGRWLERVLGPLGLIVYDASDPAAKPFAARVFAHEVSSAGETFKRASATGAALVERGYHAQVQSPDHGLALFHLGEGRESIPHQNGHFSIGSRQVSAADLAREAAATPSAFSPKVLLRPIVQDTIFPTICYVAGPSELAYLGQLARVYEHFAVPMPLIYPRATATLVDSAALRFLTKFEINLETLQPQDDGALNHLIERLIPARVETAFVQAREAIAQPMQRLIEAMPALDPSLEGAARNTLGKMEHDLDSLHGKMIQAAKRRDDTLRRQFQRTRALTFPDGHPQERAIGFVWFLNQYGPALVQRLYEAMPLDLGHHWVVAV
jgi:bacillithiol synthase